MQLRDLCRQAVGLDAPLRAAPGACGIAVMGWRLGLEPGAAIRLGATFLPGDVIKNVAVAVVAAAVFRAFPDMLRQRR